MNKYFKWKVLLIIAVTAASLWKIYPQSTWSQFPATDQINLGLDLQGGMHLVLRVDLDAVPEAAREDAADRALEVIRNRIDEFGVREPVISKQGKDRIIVQLPGITDYERAKNIIGKTALLEFRLVADDQDLITKARETKETGEVPEGYEWLTLKDERIGAEELLVQKGAKLTGDHLVNANVEFDQSGFGQPIVSLEFDSEGGRVFSEITSDAAAKFRKDGTARRLAIVLDGELRTAPQMREAIPGGKAVIEGNFSYEDASDTALVLRAGALPAPVVIEEQRSVGPSLGRDSIEKGIKSGLAGAALVFIFMPLYYLLCGLVANIGLTVYIFMVFGALAALGSSLTLPGIAGFILSLGMAVDANVLISERIREELQTGKMPRSAISAGYHKAFSAILDSNVAIFITSVILFYMGTGPVKGFAVTLGLGQIASMFSSLTVTRVVLDFLSSRNPQLSLKMMQFIGTTHIHFLKGRFWAYGFSVLTLTLGIAAFIMRGHENFGVEFTGGTFVQVEFKNPVDMAKLRATFAENDMAGAVIQHYGAESENQFIIKVTGSDTVRIEETVRGFAGEGQYEVLRIDQVGPAVSQDLRGKALKALFWACLGILIYLGMRFEWKFALAAVVALVHDTLFTFGVYALSGREINLPIVAAILTIIGYSVNDTIVIFDRVRDNVKTMRRTPFYEIVESSVNQTLSRTMLTSFIVLLATAALFFFGGSGINDFAFCLLIGFSIGVYSTIFVATALVVDWKAR